MPAAMFKQDRSLDALLHRSKPGFWSLFFRAPFSTLANTLYQFQQARMSSFGSNIHNRDVNHQHAVSIVCVSDTHNSQPMIPTGDLFIHAGDLTQGGTWAELQTALDWINNLPHQYKVVIAGNHDMFLDAKLPKKDDQDRSLDWGSIIYLEDTSTVLRFKGGRALKIHGTPHTRKHGSWGFQYPPGTDVFTNSIPDDTDILVSHSPPRFHLDVDGWGDDYLLHELWRVKPALHVFGHVHEGYGKEVLIYDSFQSYYEQICRTNGLINMWYLLKMGLCYLSNRWHLWLWSGQTMVAVNPSAVGGLRDTVKRQAIVVTV